MEDLDLDELDQAVNKMMDKPSRGKRAPRSDSSQTSVATVIADPASVPVRDTPAAEPVPPPEPEEEPSAPAPRQAEPTRVTVNRPMPRVPERRRMHPGAMDIIQPATSSKVNAPSARAGRTAADLRPTKEVISEPIAPVAALPQPQESRPEPAFKPPDTSQDVSDEVLASLSMLDEPKAANPSLLSPEPASAAGKKSSDGWPDPLDFHDFGDKSEQPAAAPEPSPVPEPVKPELVTPDIPAAPVEAEEQKDTPPSMETEPVSVNDSHEDAATSSSPFLMTKVEKRPLGAYADTPAETPKAELPEPLDTPVPHESTSKGEMAEASFESKQHLDAPDEHDPTDLRSMTIPPQYHKGEPQTKDDLRNVFDTKEYHAPPAQVHTAHKSGPGLVIGVVVLIVLIIAAVAVGYFMMTGTFDVTQLW